MTPQLLLYIHGWACIYARRMTFKAGLQCDARPCVALICKMQICIIKIFSNFFCDQMQGHNAKERLDRIRVYSSVVLHCDECQCEGDATQHMVQRHIVNRP